MKRPSLKFSRLVVAALLVAALGSMARLQGPATPAAAQEPPAGEPVLSVVVVPESDQLGIAGIGAAPVFQVGDTFKVSIVAMGVADPGIFGSQFELTFDTTHLAVVDGSLASGLALEPVVIARSDVDPGAGLVQYAAARQGNVDNVSGDVVLATLSFEAVGPTEPPEGQTTVIHLQNVKLGAKGGVEVPVQGLVDLEVIIVGDTGDGDVAGNVTVEGRAADNQAGHTVTGAGDLGGAVSATTAADGSFLIDNAPADTYTFTADSAGFLAVTCSGVAHSAGGLTTLNPVVLLAGDINGDNAIDITDAVAIGAVFGSTTPGETADLNTDGEVNILDLVLMAVNFGQTSGDNPWVCQ